MLVVPLWSLCGCCLADSCPHLASLSFSHGTFIVACQICYANNHIGIFLVPNLCIIFSWRMSKLFDVKINSENNFIYFVCDFIVDNLGTPLRFNGGPILVIKLHK